MSHLASLSFLDAANTLAGALPSPAKVSTAFEQLLLSQTSVDRCSQQELLSALQIPSGVAAFHVNKDSHLGAHASPNVPDNVDTLSTGASAALSWSALPGRLVVNMQTLPSQQHRQQPTATAVFAADCTETNPCSLWMSFLGEGVELMIEGFLLPSSAATSGSVFGFGPFGETLEELFPAAQAQNQSIRVGFRIHRTQDSSDHPLRSGHFWVMGSVDESKLRQCSTEPNESQFTQSRVLLPMWPMMSLDRQTYVSFECAALGEDQARQLALLAAWIRQRSGASSLLVRTGAGFLRRGDYTRALQCFALMAHCLLAVRRSIVPKMTNSADQAFSFGNDSSEQS